MTQAEKTASAYRLRQLNFPLRPTDGHFPYRISAISELVAGVDDDACRSMQDFLRAECAGYLKSAPESSNATKAILLAECIRLDPTGGRSFLADLLTRVDVFRPNSDGDACSLIAIATFQADPEGEAFVPGSEVVDTVKNPLSDSYIDRGDKVRVSRLARQSPCGTACLLVAFFGPGDSADLRRHSPKSSALGANVAGVRRHLGDALGLARAARAPANEVPHQAS